MNHIDHIEIKNFKSIRHVRLEGCKRINVLVGPPNVGKSNVLEALGLFCLNQRDAIATTTHSDVSFRFNDICRINEPVDIFFNKDYTQMASVSVNEELGMNISSLQNDEKLQLSYSERRLGIQYNYLIEVRVPDFAIVHHAGISEFNGLRLCERVKMYIYNEHNSKTLNGYLSLSMPTGGNMSRLIAANEKIRNIFIDLLKINNLKPHVVADGFGVAKELSNGVIITFGSNLMADTLKRLLFHLAAIESNKDSVLLLEEPESHMYPVYISKLTGQMMYDENNNQFFLATHSPYVLNDLLDQVREDVAIYICSYVNGETVIQRMTDEEMLEAAQFGYDFFMNLENFVKS